MIKSLIILMLTGRIAVSTVDINLPEMKYIADHLKPEECRKLVASLHYKSYEPPKKMYSDGENENDSRTKRKCGKNTKKKLSDKETPCLVLLLHWNSGEEEGKDETHELLFKRLKQNGRHDLADWLAKTVFQSLGVDLHKKVNEPFQEFIDNTDNGKDIDKDSFSVDDFALEKAAGKFSDDKSTFLNEGSSGWVAFDTVCWVVILLLALATIVLVVRAVCKSRKERKPKPYERNRKSRDRSYGKYEKMENRPINNAPSDTESEDRFDVRKQSKAKNKKEDPALKLMK